MKCKEANQFLKPKSHLESSYFVEDWGIPGNYAKTQESFRSCKNMFRKNIVVNDQQNNHLSQYTTHNNDREIF